MENLNKTAAENMAAPLDSAGPHDSHNLTDGRGSERGDPIVVDILEKSQQSPTRIRKSYLVFSAKILPIHMAMLIQVRKIKRRQMP